ncbi:MAG: hypothetical protein A2315_02365 [Ignavibacteria bacterium RIFOXYB2_FULL_35_12]|nr:MAG: hypothetical protein A2058_14510 [Ignavibacteria bacterium GWA2_36_19]OGU50630.1 MAG: hypothetical protein A2006_07185 [Ignavibacteria bacterium GWC2_35_8]OGU59096.1 MAG: hypothetical protein A2X60_05375 [Ignavibacteria bacterium GWF2_35_20]OGU79347.1 MAG: hypothetical protein A2254_09410 [Ignavibacteria bacterium RIFOXYA2_FULL_35_9]OGU83539.1 MAG: hypothetical protein A2W11_12630 [Ignavibacteria bacterium RBG_16_35_7]OGU88638.1 MAG: hypothetical protein A3K31_06545 [Ignavibacteria bac
MKSLVFFILLITTAAHSQELNCKVTINFESIPVVNRELLSDFAQTIEDYLNKTRFTDKWEGDKIECAFNIFFVGASSDINYSAQAVITSQRPIYNSAKNSLMLSINDAQWTFIYEKNQTLYATQSVFDPLTSFLDYYAYVIIGFDLDSYDELAGNPYFAKAFDIVNLGANSSSRTGWEKTSSSYSRRGLVEDLLNEKYRPFREAYFNYHYNGLDIFSDKKTLAVKNIIKLIDALEILRTKVDINSVLLKTFFDAKSGEIIENLKTYSDKSVFKKLRKIDPSHGLKYDEAAQD